MKIQLVEVSNIGGGNEKSAGARWGFQKSVGENCYSRWGKKKMSVGKIKKSRWGVKSAGGGNENQPVGESERKTHMKN